MGRKKKKPGYDPQRVMQELMESVSTAYLEERVSLRTLAYEFDLNPVKVRKLLITAGVYESELADEVGRLFHNNLSVKAIAGQLQMSVASVNSYLPYTKMIYNAKELSVTAERIRKYRERKLAVEELQNTLSVDTLWKVILLFEGYPFRTSKNLKFHYVVKGNEIFVNRKEKSITKSTISLAFEKARGMEGIVDGPKKLGTFGASYLYPMFVRFGVIKNN